MSPRVPKAEKNPLDDLYKLIEKGHLQKEVSYQGKVYTFKSLNDEEYTWRDQFVNTTNAMAMLSSQRAPTLAVSTVAIDGVPVEQMGLDDYPEGYPDTLRTGESAFLIPYNLFKKVYSQMPRFFLIELHNLFVTQIEKPSQNITEDDVKKS